MQLSTLNLQPTKLMLQ